MEKQFDAPQMIRMGDVTYGLNKQKDNQVSYFELAKQPGSGFKRTDQVLNTNSSELSKGIKEGAIQVLMPSKSFVQETSEKAFIEKFKSPSIIIKDEKTFGFAKQEQSKVTYFELEKSNGHFKRSQNKLETEVTDLVKEIRSGAVRVILPHKDYVAEKNKDAAARIEVGAKRDVSAKQVPETEIKPVHVEPLNARERKEVKEAFQEGRLNDEKHAKGLFKKFEKQLDSVPDHVHGKNLNNEDKLKMLVGDLNDHQNNKYSIQKDKTVTFEGKEKGLLTNAHAQYSESQLVKKNMKAEQSQSKGLSI